jgi:hypothetical protein
MTNAASRFVRGGAAGICTTALGLCFNVVVPFVFLRKWSGDEFGMWIAATGWFGIWGTIDYAHQTYVGNKFTASHFRGDKDGVFAISEGMGVAATLGLVKIVVAVGFWIAVSKAGAFLVAMPLLVVQSAHRKGRNRPAADI